MTIKIARFGLLLLTLCLVSAPVRAESNCSGPIYSNPTCDGACDVANCQDVSIGGTGDEFQCCDIPIVPEFPEWVNPFYLALFLTLGLVLFRRPGVRPGWVRG